MMFSKTSCLFPPRDNAKCSFCSAAPSRPANPHGGGGVFPFMRCGAQRVRTGIPALGLNGKASYEE
ncbi:Uncharacterised protein [Bordetella pertussis]|nr:Uncharacterised protein [Bordetella pertussis]